MSAQESLELKGIPASKGIAEGKAKVFRNQRAIKKALSAGTVLVVPSLSPDLVIFVKRVSAIVTDAGGIASHAAIIAREFNIPCVVNTKVATRKIISGSRVTVNGTEGVVQCYQYVRLDGILDDIEDSFGIKWRRKIENSILSIADLANISLNDIIIRRAELLPTQIYAAALDEFDFHEAKEFASKYSKIPPVTVVQKNNEFFLYMGAVRSLEFLIKEKPIESIIIKLPKNSRPLEYFTRATITIFDFYSRIKKEQLQ